jgi:hypothetical protein
MPSVSSAYQPRSQNQAHSCCKTPALFAAKSCVIDEEIMGQELTTHATMGISQLDPCPVKMEILRLSEDALQTTACLFPNRVLGPTGCMKVDALRHLSVETPKDVLGA